MIQCVVEELHGWWMALWMAAASVWSSSGLVLIAVCLSLMPLAEVVDRHAIL